MITLITATYGIECSTTAKAIEAGKELNAQGVRWKVEGMNYSKIREYHKDAVCRVGKISSIHGMPIEEQKRLMTMYQETALFLRLAMNQFCTKLP